MEKVKLNIGKWKIKKVLRSLNKRPENALSKQAVPFSSLSKCTLSLIDDEITTKKGRIIAK